MSGFKLERIIDAPLEVVWDAADFKKAVGKYPTKVQDYGDSDKNDIGFTRVVTIGKNNVVERLLEVEPMQSYIHFN